MAQVKMKTLINEALWTEEEQHKLSIKEKKQCLEAIKNFGSYGKQLSTDTSLTEVAKKLSEIAENATNLALSETDEWFDKNTINRNMGELKGYSKNFQKVAQEAQRLQERLVGLYEDMAHNLGRYYDIDNVEEGIDAAHKTVGDENERPPEVNQETGQEPIAKPKASFEEGENDGPKEFFEKNIFDGKQRQVKESSPK